MHNLRLTFPLTRKLVAASLMLGSLSLTSCEKMMRDMAAQQTTKEAAGADSSATIGTSEVAAQEPLFVITYPENSPYEGLTPPAGEADNPFEKIPAITETYKESQNWADKHADINSLLLQNQGKDYYFVLQQQAANEMLRHELFAHYYQDPGNAKVMEAIGTYTEHLVEAKSEDSELIYKCLRALREYWPKEKIAQVALATSARVQARPITSAADTTTRNGKYQQVYARELKKMGARTMGEG